MTNPKDSMAKAIEVKPNCYQCKYRGDIPGDAHSRCNHPLVKQDRNPFGAMVDMLSGKNNVAAASLGIKGNATGIRRGWFMWPANFDPTWLESCNGFTAIGSSTDPEKSRVESTPVPLSPRH